MYRTASGGIVLVNDNRQGRVTLLLISDKEEGMMLMIIQPKRSTRNVNEYFYESEARRIAMLNEIFGDVELSRAVEEFKSSDEYDLLKEKLDIMERDCDTMFNKEEKDFAVECFELILEVDAKEEQYVYRRELQDCVIILKNLGVLA